MKSIAETIREIKVEEETVAVFWLGQAGFAIKTHQGRLIGIDPYLSDYCEHLLTEFGCGYKRMMPSPFGADDLVFDCLLISHEHPDHLDADSIGTLSAHPGTKIYTNETCAKILEQLGISQKKIQVLQIEKPIRLEEVTLVPVRADHGSQCPDALGFLLDFDFVTVYYAGDTSYHPEVLSVPLALRPEIALLPINGAFGNLDSSEAAQLAENLYAKELIPYHFWTFPLHMGDPARLLDEMKGKKCNLRMLTPGEPFVYGL